MSWGAVRGLAPTELRKLGKMVGPNDGTRTLIESVTDRGVIAALDDWRQAGLGGVLIGTVGLSFHAKPRFSDQIKLFVPDSIGQPEPVGFEHMGQRALIHQRTGTKLRLLTPDVLDLSRASIVRIWARASSEQEES